MELEPTSVFHWREKTYQIPPDVNTDDNLFSQQHWYSRLGLPTPIVHVIHITLMVIFGILSLIFGIRLSIGLTNSHIFWEVLPEFLSAMISTIVITLIQSVLSPAFWRARARQMIDEGCFASSTNANGKRRLVLEIGCNEGWISAIFARAIIGRQRDLGKLSAPYAALPVFIGYDRWTRWSRFPNNPACFLSTLLRAGVPRDHIIANRVDMTSEESKTSLPYPSGSISFVICNYGLGELFSNRKKRTILFQELARILEPEGRMVLVERDGVGKVKFRRGAMESYKRMLVEDMGWEKESVAVQRHLGVRYLVAVKPSGTSRTV